MYKYQTGPEPDHNGYEWVSANARCDDCGRKYKNCECGELIEDDDPDAPVDELEYGR